MISTSFLFFSFDVVCINIFVSCTLANCICRDDTVSLKKLFLQVFGKFINFICFVSCLPLSGCLRGFNVSFYAYIFLKDDSLHMFILVLPF